MKRKFHNFKMLNLIKDFKLNNKKLFTTTNNGEEVILEPVKLDDAPLFAEWRKKTQKWFYGKYDPTLGYIKKFLKKDYIENDKAIMFMLSSKGTKFGCVSIYDVDVKNKSAEYGRSMRGLENIAKGGITSGTKKLLSWAFSGLGLEKVYLSVFAHNIKAKNIYYKSGFIISSADIPLEEKKDRWIENPDLGDKAKAFSTHMEITKNRYDYLVENKLW